MYILVGDFARKKNDKYIFIFFRNKSDDYLCWYIRNLENSRLKPVFGTQYPFVFVLACSEYSMDIVLSKIGVK